MPASNPEKRLRALFTCIGDLIASKHGLWLSSLRLDDCAPNDPLKGWRVRSIYFYGELAADQEVYKKTVKRLDQGGTIDESTHNHVRQAGSFRATLLVDHVSSSFYQGDHYRHHYLGRGIKDRLFVVLPVNEDVESFFIFDRLLHEPDFSHADLETAAFALRSLTWFNRQLHLSYGQLVADKPLTPTERQVLRKLLTGRAEKVIAHDIGQSHNTTHEYIIRLFRKFNVRSRAELTAFWLGH